MRIETEEQYQAAMAELLILMDLPPFSDEQARELDALADEIGEYEKLNYPAALEQMPEVGEA